MNNPVVTKFTFWCSEQIEVAKKTSENDTSWETSERTKAFKELIALVEKCAAMEIER